LIFIQAYANMSILCIPPAEQILEQATAKIELQRQSNQTEEKRQERAAITEKVDLALDYLPDYTELPDYITADDQKLDITISQDSIGVPNRPNSRRTSVIEINGQLTDLSSGITADLPMYRVSRKIPDSDTIGSLPGRYEIAVADPEAETGYTTLALVHPITREHARHVRGSDFGSERSPTANQLEALVTDGYYKDPRSTAMFDEILTILDMAVTQEMEAQVAANPADVGV
jgi:hypothetical protein